MKHKINPQIDCVFKAILGSERNKLLLIDFLNSILQPIQPIENVNILNPFNEKDFMSDKLTVVDIKAEDTLNRQFQIEIQIANYSYLPQRMLYTWCDIYGAQLQSGENYTGLAPVISIWLLAKELFIDSDIHHHHFQLHDKLNQRSLTEDCSIHVVELNKWQKPDSLTHSDHWVYFFKEAHNWLKLPLDLNTPAMRQAMATLQGYSEKELEYDRYRRRKLYLLDQATIKKIQEMEKETLKQEIEEATQKNQGLNKKNDLLGKVNDQLDKDNNQLDKKNNELGKENNELGKENNELGKENNELGKENHRLTRENLQLGKESADSKSEIQRLRRLLKANGVQ